MVPEFPVDPGFYRLIYLKLSICFDYNNVLVNDTDFIIFYPTIEQELLHRKMLELGVCHALSVAKSGPFVCASTM